MTGKGQPSDLDAQTIEEYAEEYLRQQTHIRRGVDFLKGLVRRPPPLFVGLLPERTITMISAEPFCGKTMLTLAMALCLDQNKPLLGRFPPRERQRVLYLGQDAPSWDYAEQFRKLARGMSINPDTEVEIDFLLNEGGSLVDRRFLAELQHWHEEVGYHVIIFDTLAAFHDLDENDSRQMGAIMAILKRFRDQLNCSVIFTHHSRKPSGETPVSANYSARGSSVIPGSIDFHLSLRRTGAGILLNLPKGRGSEHLDAGSGFRISEGDTPTGPYVRLEVICGDLPSSSISVSPSSTSGQPSSPTPTASNG